MFVLGFAQIFKVMSKTTNLLSFIYSLTSSINKTTKGKGTDSV